MTHQGELKLLRAPPAHAARLAAPRIRIRWRVFALLFAFGLMAYVQQRSLSVAAYQMMPLLKLTQVQIGWLEWAFILGYTALQFPGGVLGQRLGARVTLVGVGLLAFLATVITPLAPLMLGGVALLGALLAVQLLLGIAQCPLFPVSAGVFETWFPTRQWPLVQGMQSLGLQLGAAATPPLLAGLMYSFGWQKALLWTALPALAVIVVWAWYGRNTPTEHPAVGAAELDELGPRRHPQPCDSTISLRRIGKILENRNVLVLTLSYLCMNYVFYLLANWCFLYLIQERHFTMLQGGWLAGAPPLAAALGAGGGGCLASAFFKRHGLRWGLHIVPLASLPLAGLLLLGAVHTQNPYLAVAGLTLCYGCVELNEGPYWAAMMHVGRADTMAATGILNTGGNAGGLIATPLVGYLSGRHAWTSVFVVGAIFAAVSAAAWLLVDPTRGVEGQEER